MLGSVDSQIQWGLYAHCMLQDPRVCMKDPIGECNYRELISGPVSIVYLVCEEVA